MIIISWILFLGTYLFLCTLHILMYIPEKCSTAEASLPAIVNLHWCFSPEFTNRTKRIIKMEFQRLVSWRCSWLMEIGLRLSISWISWLQLHIDHLEKNREVNKIENIKIKLLEMWVFILLGIKVKNVLRVNIFFYRPVIT